MMNKPQHFNTDADVARAVRAVPMDVIPNNLTLHPDTDPDAIRATQREAIFEVGNWSRLSEAELSSIVCLPVDVVRRRVAEIRKAMRRRLAV